MLCPMRWIMCANELASIVSKYVALQGMWDEAFEIGK